MGKLTRKIIGHVGVDSGQLLVTDPCYISSEEWRDKEFLDYRLYKHIEDGVYFSYGEIPKEHLPVRVENPKVFSHYDEKIHGGKSLNDMEQAGEVDEVAIPAKEALKGDYSYGGCSETSISSGHQLNYRLGHAGAGVVFRSGYGDGYYPVYGYFNSEGRCMKVEIDMR